MSLSVALQPVRDLIRDQAMTAVVITSATISVDIYPHGQI